MKTAVCFLGIMALVACKTEDVDGPASGARVNISTSRLAISEQNDTAQISISLSESADVEVVVNLGFSGSAVYGVDYGSTTTQVRLPAGTTQANFNIYSFQDSEVEGEETVNVSIQTTDGALIGSPSSVTLKLEDDDSQPSSFGMVLNEICYDPSNNGLDGDANADGQYAQSEDEFVELVNISAQNINLDGYKVYDQESWDAKTPNHVFPAGTSLASGRALVLFGGGSPTGNFAGALVQTSSSGDLNLNNAGDVFYFTTPNDSILIQFDIAPLSDNPNESYTRNPDLTGDFEQHSENGPLLFSPGARRDLSPF